MLDIDKMKKIKTAQEAWMNDMEKARVGYNDAVDMFDEAVWDCEYYEPAICHGEDDPECDHKDNEVKWCEAENCPLIK